MDEVAPVVRPEQLSDYWSEQVLASAQLIQSGT